VIITAWSWTILNAVSFVILNPTLPSDTLIVATLMEIVVIVASGLSTHFLGRRYQHVLKDRPEESQLDKKTEETSTNQSSSKR